MIRLVDKASSEEFKNIVETSSCYNEAILKLGYTNPKAKHTYDAFKERVIRESLNTSHFSQHRKPSGESRNQVLVTKDLLVQNSTVKNISSFKKRLVREGLLEYKCVECGNGGMWMGASLTLQLDHVNGNNIDNRIENIRFICPNCHSQTTTYSGRNKNK